ncbi:MAG: cell envelope integrity protein TolA, partial [Lautropia sp.]|nr:cell envelope integrity protein TolA [Lautropia sp.]
MATRNTARIEKKAKRPGRGPLPFLLALIVHVGLFAFLFVGVRWQKTTPIAQAELWVPSMVVENTPPPEPTPAP